MGLPKGQSTETLGRYPGSGAGSTGTGGGGTGGGAIGGVTTINYGNVIVIYLCLTQDPQLITSTTYNNGQGEPVIITTACAGTLK